MSELTLDVAQKMVGKTISLSNELLEEDAEAKVAEIVESNACGPDWETFTVVLDLGETPPEVNQGIYALKSDDYNSEHIFVSPNSHTECEIVVSRKRA